MKTTNYFFKRTWLTTLVIFFIFSCSKEKENEVNTSGISQKLTKEIDKIETIYEEGDLKNEGQTEFIEEETVLPAELINKIRSELENSYSKQRSYAKSGNNLVAVFKDNTCGSYAQLDVNMDCQDNNGMSYKTGYTGASDVSPNLNVRLKFCVVDVDFLTTLHDYAVLNLTTLHPSGVNRINRYFDNEDTKNNNSTFYGGSSYFGYFGDSYFGNNTILAFYYYPGALNPEDASPFPSLGFPYYVLGSFGSYQGTIFSDDENTNNANYCQRYYWNGNGWDYYYSGPGNDLTIPNIMRVNVNTYLYLSKVY